LEVLLLGELEYVQKKTFTKWINSHLRNSGFKVHDLFHDLRDGIILIKLLEIVSGEPLVRSNKNLSSRDLLVLVQNI
jgi:hypothetical protein